MYASMCASKNMCGQPAAGDMTPAPPPVPLIIPQLTALLLCCCCVCVCLPAAQLAAGDGFTVALAPNGSVYGCGTFKDDVGGLSGFTDKTKVQSVMALLYTPKHAQDEVRDGPAVQPQACAGPAVHPQACAG